MKRLILFGLWMLLVPDLILLIGLLLGAIQQVSLPMYIACCLVCGVIFLLICRRRDRPRHPSLFPSCYRCHGRDMPTHLYRFQDGNWPITASLCWECALIMEGRPVV